MASGNLERLSRFFRNCISHVKRLARRKESAGDVMKAVRKDARYLARGLAEGGDSEGRKQAYRVVKKGREAYNARDYLRAEDLFRQAILVDGRYSLAFTYLGYALYQQGRRTEAMTYWAKACEIDPDSEAAKKARLKMQVVANQKADIERWIDSSTTGFE